MSEVSDTHPERSTSFLFVHSSVDDFGLTPAEFRILGHISRRCGNKTQFLSQANIATHVGLALKTVKKGIKELSALNVLKKTSRVGQACTYAISPPSEWQPRVLNALGQKTPEDTNDPTRWGKTDPRDLGQKRPHKGNPSKGDPKKGIPIAEIELQFPLSFQSQEFRKAWAEWQTYYRTTRRGKASKRGINLTFQKQLDRDLAGMTEAQAIACIDQSISKGWTGLFPVKEATSFAPYGKQLQKANHASKPEDVF